MAKKCFVIMPYTVRDEQSQKYPIDHWREVYHALILKAVKKATLECYVDYEDSSSRHIAHDIWRKIEEADIVLCDLSSYNPNAFLELGWALRADKPYVLIKDELTAFPFDLNQVNTLTYDHNLRPFALNEQITKLAKMLTDTLMDAEKKYSIIHNLGIPFNRPTISTNNFVDIYYYKSSFTRKDANVIASKLRSIGIEPLVLEHDGFDGPDAIFIGAMVDVNIARLIMGLIPYEVKYLFRPDYPESEGGDSDGYKVGIGYSSKYNENRRTKRAEPIPISSHQLIALFDDDHTNSSFHRMLWEIALELPK